MQIKLHKYSSNMDILLIVLGAICLLLGLVGCVAPVVPGVPLSYLGLLLLHWTERVQFSWQFLVVWGVVVVVIQILNYFIPAWGTKKFGGTKYGVWGSTIGLFAGFFMGPLGIIIGPFIGAVAGEMLGGQDLSHAIRAGVGTLLGFLFGTLMKVVVCFYFFVQGISVFI